MSSLCAVEISSLDLDTVMAVLQKFVQLFILLHIHPSRQPGVLCRSGDPRRGRRLKIPRVLAPIFAFDVSPIVAV